MRVVLFGWGDIACAALDVLREEAEDVAVVVTHADVVPGFASLAERAATSGIEVVVGDTLSRPDVVALVERIAPELVLSVYYRRMLPMAALERAARGGLNLHGSLLPVLRGRAPLNWAILERHRRTGVTLHHMTAVPDAGDVVAQRGWDIGARDTAKTLYDRAVRESASLLRETWSAIRAGTASRTKQDEARATYRGRRRPEDGRIDWARPAVEIDALVRAVTTPYPGAFTTLADRTLTIWSGEPREVGLSGAPPGTVLGPALVATGDGAFRLDRYELADAPGRAPPLAAGTRLGVATMLPTGTGRS